MTNGPTAYYTMDTAYDIRHELSFFQPKLFCKIFATTESYKIMNFNKMHTLHIHLITRTVP